MLILFMPGIWEWKKSLKRAPDLILLPRISNGITKFVLNYTNYMYVSNIEAPIPKIPLMPHTIPEYPWQIVGTDYFTWNQKDSSVVADYYSHYFEVNSCGT